jgi:hypothetical protein
MERSLKKEGIKVKNDKIVDFEKHSLGPDKRIGFLATLFLRNKRVGKNIP